MSCSCSGTFVTNLKLSELDVMFPVFKCLKQDTSSGLRIHIFEYISEGCLTKLDYEERTILILKSQEINRGIVFRILSSTGERRTSLLVSLGFSECVSDCIFHSSIFINCPWRLTSPAFIQPREFQSIRT